jgi:periplasmic protein TonB
MSTDERDGAPGNAAATELFHPGDPSAGSAGETLRLLLAPALVTVMLVGGYYWLHQQPTGPAQRRQAATTVAVRLLPEPVLAPIPIGPAPRKPVENLASRTDVSTDATDPTTADTMALVQPQREAIPPKAPTPHLRPTSSPFGAPPSATSIRFQQALSRHIAGFQRYPNAAKRDRLHGAVEVLFSMRRDGTLIGAWVKGGSGAAVLDNAAIDAIRRAQPLPAIPAELPEPLNIQIPLIFEPS